MLKHLLKILELNGGAICCLVKELHLMIDYIVELEIKSQLYFQSLNKIWSNYTHRWLQLRDQILICVIFKYCDSQIIEIPVLYFSEYELTNFCGKKKCMRTPHLIWIR